MLRVLFINHETDVIGGSTLSLENLLRSVEGLVDPRIVVREEGVVSSYLRKAGYDTFVIPFPLVKYRGKLLRRIIHFIPHCFYIWRERRRFTRQVLNELGSWSPEIIHTNSSIIDIGLILAKALDVPHVWHIREFLDIGFDLHFFPSKRSWRKKFAQSDAIIAVSSAIFEHYELRRYPRAYWINDAVRPASFCKTILSKEKYFVFCASSIVDIKRPDVAVAAFRDSEVWRQGFKLRMIGNCPEAVQQNLKCIAKEAAPALEFPGYCEDIREHMLHASAFLMTSLYEGFGRVTVEAMFCGCPVISRRTTGSLDIIQDGATGFFFDTDEECSHLIADLAKRTPEKVIEAAAVKAVSMFSEESYGKRLMEVYRSIARDSKPLS